MPRRIVAFAVAAAVIAPLHAAGPILDSATRYASHLTPALGCSRATSAGDAAAERREGTAAWFAAGLLLPGLMPWAASNTDPLPTTTARDDVAPSDARCFEAGYRLRGRSERVRSAWIGSGIGIALYVVLAAVVAGGVDSSRRW